VGKWLFGSRWVDVLMIRARTKKCRVGGGDPNLRSRPCLPGSVVGEPSMRQGRETDKITRGIVL
jgi:hypothetical protein